MIELLSRKSVVLFPDGQQNGDNLLYLLWQDGGPKELISHCK